MGRDFRILIQRRNIVKQKNKGSSYYNALFIDVKS